MFLKVRTNLKNGAISVIFNIPDLDLIFFSIYPSTSNLLHSRCQCTTEYTEYRSFSDETRGPTANLNLLFTKKNC